MGLICMAVVEVGDSGNPSDTQTGLGTVAQPFALGKYEVTLDQYLCFLNAIATKPRELPVEIRGAILELWLPEMKETHEYVSKDGLIDRKGHGTTKSPFTFKEVPDPTWGTRSGQRGMLNIS